MRQHDYEHIRVAVPVGLLRALAVDPDINADNGIQPRAWGGHCWRRGVVDASRGLALRGAATKSGMRFWKGPVQPVVCS